MVEVLVSKGADINSRTIPQSIYSQVGGKTALHYGARLNSTDICKILITKGVDLNPKDSTFLKVI